MENETPRPGELTEPDTGIHADEDYSNADFREAIDASSVAEELDEELADLQQNPPEHVFSDEDNS